MRQAWSSNDWPGNWVSQPYEPELKATVVLPAFNNPEQLDAAVAGLSLQDYPRDLTEVIVADDGSSPPLQVENAYDLDITFTYQADEGFRAGANRNTGALKATGQVLLFLDSDMIPNPDWLTEHMRMHHLCPWMLAIGFRRHVDPAPPEPAELKKAGGPHEYFRGEEFEEPTWLLDYWREFADGREHAERIWRATSSGNMSISSAAFWSIGGFDEATFTEWGGEDNEFGYRAYQKGVFVVPNRKAIAWHLGLGTSASSRVESTRRRVRQLLSLKIPDTTLQPPSGLIPDVPTLWVQYRNEKIALDDLLFLVEQADLASAATAITIDVGRAQPYYDHMVALAARQPSLHVGDSSESPVDWTRAQVVLATSHDGWTSRQLDGIAGRVREGSVGKLHVMHAGGGVSTATLARLTNQVAAGLIAQADVDSRFGALRVSETSL